MASFVRVVNLTNRAMGLPSVLGTLPSSGSIVKEISVNQIETIRTTLLKLSKKKLIDFTIYSDSDQNTDNSLSTEFYTAQQTTQVVSGGGFIYTQTDPSSVWVINHNLGYRPEVQISTPGGSVVYADILHTSLNQVRVTLNTPISGIARCA